MIGELFGRLVPGDNVNIGLQFRNAGPLDVDAPVIAYGDPAPTGSAPSDSQHHSSGARP